MRPSHIAATEIRIADHPGDVKPTRIAAAESRDKCKPVRFSPGDVRPTRIMASFGNKCKPANVSASDPKQLTADHCRSLQRGFSHNGNINDHTIPAFVD